MRISDWSSDVCSSDLFDRRDQHQDVQRQIVADGEKREQFEYKREQHGVPPAHPARGKESQDHETGVAHRIEHRIAAIAIGHGDFAIAVDDDRRVLQYLPSPLDPDRHRSEEHTSELQSLMRISYAVFCLKK